MRSSWLSRSVPLLIAVNVAAALVHVWTVLVLVHRSRG